MLTSSLFVFFGLRFFVLPVDADGRFPLPPLDTAIIIIIVEEGGECVGIREAASGQLSQPVNRGQAPSRV